MTLHIELDMSGSAFSQDGGPGLREELEAILGRAALDASRMWSVDMPLLDSNGNTCGRAWTTED